MLWPELLFLLAAAQVTTRVEAMVGARCSAGHRAAPVAVAVAVESQALAGWAAGCPSHPITCSSLDLSTPFGFAVFFRHRHWLCLHKEEIYAIENNQTINNP